MKSKSFWFPSIHRSLVAWSFTAVVSPLTILLYHETASAQPDLVGTPPSWEQDAAGVSGSTEAQVYDITVFEINRVAANVWTPGLIDSLRYPANRYSRKLSYYANNVGLTFGCVRFPDTLTCTSTYSWVSGRLEAIVPNSKRYGLPQFAPYDPETASDLEIFGISTDTVSYNNYDEADGTLLSPIGIELHQATMGWRRSYLDRAVIVDNWIVNISDTPIEDACLAVGISGYVFNEFHAFLHCEPNGTMSGFIPTVPGIVAGVDDTINLAWVADNDGDPECSLGGYKSNNPLAALGIRILRAPKGGRFSFNWWDRAFWWGPRRRTSTAHYPKEPAMPMSDRSLYRMMTNGEVDYDQPLTAVDMSAEGWIRPPTDTAAKAIANGSLPALMLSVGPFDKPILPGDSVPFTYALVMGDDFHTDPTHFARTFDYQNPAPYLNGLNFTNLISAAQWAGWFFDNPGIDTDGDGYAGDFHLIDCNGRDCDSVYYTGDGIPDFKGPLPPPPPDDVSLETFPGKIIVRWTGKATEYARDRHVRRPDFEGYRVYIADSDTGRGWSLLGHWDREDYVRFSYSDVKETWIRNSHPRTIEEWRAILSDSQFDPLDHTMPSFSSAYHDIATDTVRTASGSIIDIVQKDRWSYFATGDANHGNEYRDADGVHRSMIQNTGTIDTAVDGQMVPYGIYELEIDDLSQSKIYYIAVTAFDYGDYRNFIDPEESQPRECFQRFMAINAADVVADSNLRVNVYPNPYKIQFHDALGNVATYFSQGFEVAANGTFDERDRRIWFANLPDTATVEIYSLDGDLIRLIYHPDPFLTRYNSAVGWDLISRNTQAVTSGIYIWRVTSRLGEQIGKLVIIK